MQSLTGFLAILGLSLFVNSASAAICDYRPSQFLEADKTSSEKIGSAAIASVGAGGAVVAASGVGANAVGIYTLTHATTGLTMLGSTAAGSSAAGTIGIISGTGGALGTVGAVVTAPATIIAAAATAVVVGGYEGACFFTDERITDHNEVLAVVTNLAANANPEYFKLDDLIGDGKYARIFVKNEDGEFDKYDVADLYIVNGVLKNRDWFLNTTIGRVGFQFGSATE